MFIKIENYYNDRDILITRIIDSDFEEEYGAGVSDFYTMPINIVIGIYYRRKLNVAKNLILFHLSWERNRNWTISDQIEYYATMSSEYSLYVSEIKKYMMFI